MSSLKNIVKENKRQIALFFALVSFVILNIPRLDDPYFWDELGVYANAALYLHDHQISLLPAALPAELSRGHPLFFVFLHSLNFKIFGTDVLAAHSLALVISFFLIIVLFIFSKKYFRENVALFSCLLLMVQPVFIAQSTFVLPEILLALLFVSSVFFVFQKRFFLYFIFSSLALLVKESALMLPLIVATVFFLNGFFRGKGLRNTVFQILKSLSPFSVLVLFLFFQKLQNGWFFFPYHLEVISCDVQVVFEKFKDYLGFLFWQQGRFLWLALLICFFILASFKKLKNGFIKLDPNFSLLAFGIFAYLFFSSFNFYMERYMLPVFPFLAILVATGIDQLFRNQKITYGLCAIVFLLFPFSFLNSGKFNYDIDFSYRKQVEVQKEATEFLEKTTQKPDKIFANFPLIYGLKDKRYGYLKTADSLNSTAKPDKAITISAIANPGNYDYHINAQDSFELIEEFSESYASVKIFRKQKLRN